MTYYTLVQLIGSLIRFYSFLVLVYCLMTWFPLRPGGLADDIRTVLDRVCGPYLNIFRRLLSPMGGIDFSPVLAIIALQLIGNLLIRILAGIL